MRKTILKITIVLLVVVSLPIGFFLVDELTKLSRDEQLIGRVFNKQLESILNSVNQHSENIISYWAGSLDLPVACNSEAMAGVANNIMANNLAVEHIGFIDADTKTARALYSRNPSGEKGIDIPGGIESEPLVEFLKNNYQKIEILPVEDKTVLYFAMKNQSGDMLCFITVDPVRFIRQSLGPEIQQVSQEAFYISVADSASGDIIFSTEGNITVPEELQTATLWYFPGYTIGIRLLSQTIDEMVAERGKKGKALLWGMVAVVIVGAVFVILNIRKEIRLAELKSGFVSNVSHEIRTPLALIAMYAETLKLKRLKRPEKQEEYLDVIHAESQKLAGMVNRILNFSKIEKGKKIFHFQPLCLNELIPDILEAYKPHFEAGKVEVEYTPPESDVYINADREGITDVLVNLFDNAVKYGKETGKKVAVRCFAGKNSVSIEVEDNGVGIAAKDRQHIFDKFYRVAKGDLANRVKGSGLGLNIVKQVMKSHGGAVSVKSKVGEGSCFRLMFPIMKNKNNG